MPMTRSEAMFFTAGLVIGAAAGANYPLLKEKFGPLLAGAPGRRRVGLRRILCGDGQEGGREGGSRAGRHGRDETNRFPIRTAQQHRQGHDNLSRGHERWMIGLPAALSSLACSDRMTPFLADFHLQDLIKLTDEFAGALPVRSPSEEYRAASQSREAVVNDSPSTRHSWTAREQLKGHHGHRDQLSQPGPHSA